MKRIALAAMSVVLIAGCAPRGSTTVIPAADSQNASPRTAATGPMRFVVALPLRNEAELNRTIAAIADPDSPQYRRFLSRQAFQQRYAPQGGSLRSVAAGLQRAGFTVTISDLAVSASGTTSNVERFFGTAFDRKSDGIFAPRAEIRYPTLLTAAHATVIGLNGIVPMHRFSLAGKPFGRAPHNYRSARGPYLPIDFKQAYAMPSIQDATGDGATIAIVMDSAVNEADMDKFFQFIRAQTPRMTTVKIDGGGRFPGDGTLEATLDVQQSGGIAPGARIVLYDVPQLSDEEIYDGYAAALGDGATIVNSSFGGCEDAFNSAQGAAELATFDDLFKQGIATGVTFVAASGDRGADECGSAFDARGVSWPAVSPYVLAVGGTNLITKFDRDSNDSAYERESAFHDTKPDSPPSNYWGSGGGVSVLYPRPSWQSGFVIANARGVPDVSLEMGGLGFSGLGPCEAQKCSPEDSSDLIVEDGRFVPVIGTSASSPDMCGLLALAGQIAKSPLGDVHDWLYTAAKTAGVFRAGIPGNNGFTATKAPWDPVLGLGTPIAAYQLVGAADPAGAPGSTSNP